MILEIVSQHVGINKPKISSDVSSYAKVKIEPPRFAFASFATV